MVGWSIDGLKGERRLGAPAVSGTKRGFVSMRRHGPVEYEIYLIGLDQQLCDGCRRCVDICPVDVFEMRRGPAEVVRAENCLYCRGCLGVCDPGAIIITEI